MKAVDYWRNSDGSWTARIFNSTFTGSASEVMRWFRANGEIVTIEDPLHGPLL